MQLNNYRIGNRKKGDSSLLVLAVMLSLFGLLMISSASVVKSFEDFGSNYVYLSKQTIFFAMGITGLIITSQINYRFWRRWALWIFLTTVGLLILVKIIGISIGGSQRWLNLGFFHLQPSEIMKLSFIIYIAAWLEKAGKDVSTLKKGVIPFTILFAFAAFLIINQPDLGTTIIVSMTAAIMFTVAGANTSHIISGGSLALFIGFLLIRSAEYRWQRFLTFLNPSADLQGAGYQINQALMAIGSGGWLGLGFGQSMQKYLYLPQVQTDAIFAIIVEELGFARVIILLLVFAYFTLKGYKIAKNAPDLFGKLLATGITTWIVFQTLINVGGIMGLIPLTGVPLPFISYGGSSLVILLCAVGILYNISREVN